MRYSFHSVANESGKDFEERHEPPSGLLDVHVLHVRRENPDPLFGERNLLLNDALIGRFVENELIHNTLALAQNPLDNAPFRFSLVEPRDETIF